MFATNLVLILALIAMIVGFVWLFRDGEGPPRAPTLREKPDTDDDDHPVAPRIHRQDPPES